AQPRPRSRDTPRSPPLASKLHPGPRAPGGDGHLVTFGGPVDGGLRDIVEPVQQIPGAAQGYSARGTAGRSVWPPGPASTADPAPSPTPPGRPDRWVSYTTDASPAVQGLVPGARFCRPRLISHVDVSNIYDRE